MNNSNTINSCSGNGYYLSGNCICNKGWTSTADFYVSGLDCDINSDVVDALAITAMSICSLLIISCLRYFLIKKFGGKFGFAFIFPLSFLISGILVFTASMYRVLYPGKYYVGCNVWFTLIHSLYYAGGILGMIFFLLMTGQALAGFGKSISNSSKSKIINVISRVGRQMTYFGCPISIAVSFTITLGLVSSPENYYIVGMVFWIEWAVVFTVLLPLLSSTIDLLRTELGIVLESIEKRVTKKPIRVYETSVAPIFESVVDSECVQNASTTKSSKSSSSSTTASKQSATNKSWRELKKLYVTLSYVKISLYILLPPFIICLLCFVSIPSLMRKSIYLTLIISIVFPMVFLVMVFVISPIDFIPKSWRHCLKRSVKLLRIHPENSDDVGSALTDGAPMSVVVDNHVLDELVEGDEEEEEEEEEEVDEENGK